jgi:hypothetical protein
MTEKKKTSEIDLRHGNYIRSKREDMGCTLINWRNADNAIMYVGNW